MKYSKLYDTISSYIDLEDLDSLYSISHKWHSFGRKLLESALIEKEARVILPFFFIGFYHCRCFAV